MKSQARSAKSGQFGATGLGVMVATAPKRAASEIKAALRGRSEQGAADLLGVGLRTLRRYRRMLEDAGHLTEGLTPRGRRPRAA